MTPEEQKEIEQRHAEDLADAKRLADADNDPALPRPRKPEKSVEKPKP